MQRLVSIFSISITRTWYLAIIARLVIYFVAFKKCTTQPDNHFPAVDQERNTETLGRDKIYEMTFNIGF